MDAKKLDVIIIGGGQSALATAYFLRRTQLSFLILDAGENPAEPGVMAGTHCGYFRRPPGAPFQDG